MVKKVKNQATSGEETIKDLNVKDATAKHAETKATAIKDEALKQADTKATALKDEAKATTAKASALQDEAKATSAKAAELENEAKAASTKAHALQDEAKATSAKAAELKDEAKAANTEATKLKDELKATSTAATKLKDDSKGASTKSTKLKDEAQQVETKAQKDVDDTKDMALEAKKADTIEKPTKKQRKARRRSGENNETHEDFLTFSFVIRALIALVLYGSVFFNEWTLVNIWSPLLEQIYAALHLEGVLWEWSNYRDVVYRAYVRMYIDNMLYLMLFIVIIALFIPEIKAGARKLRRNLWQLSLIPVTHFCMMAASLIITIVISSFIAVPESSVNQEIINEAMSFSVWGNVFPTIIAAPFVEEIIFRVIIGGGIFMALTTLFNRKHLKGRKIAFSVIAIIISSIIFGYVHVTSGDYLAIFPYIVMGFGLGIMYFASGRNVLMSIGLHMYNNIFATIMQLLFSRSR
jgi:hypothetical protein